MTAAGVLPVPDPLEFYDTTERRCWDLIHGLIAARSEGVTLSDDEQELIRLGIASAITSTTEELRDRGLLRMTP